MKYADQIKKAMLLYAVTDRTWCVGETLARQVEQALKGGVTCVQLREKALNDAAFLKEALVLKELCRDYQVPLIINDNVGVALKCGADGIHIGQQDMTAKNVRALVGAKMAVGVSVQSVAQAVLAEKSGADYLGVGAVFATSTKLDADSVSKKTLKAICEAVPLPVVAIGGITKENLLELAGSGVDGVALVSAIFGSEDIEEECRALYSLSERMVLL